MSVAHNFQHSGRVVHILMMLLGELFRARGGGGPLESAGQGDVATSRLIKGRKAHRMFDLVYPALGKCLQYFRISHLLHAACDR